MDAMDKDIVINVKNVTKTYQLYNSHADRVKETFHPLRKTYYHPFNALSDVSFQIKKGDAFGIIGRNGSGKSTLLQVICGILQPTSGTVEVKGRVASLLELGTGFNPEFTGHENVYINGALLGFSRKEMDERFDEIAAFADIGEFMEQPVKTYSSGMYVRLAFAVQACVEPEILIVDEALSVGDIFFQQKCLRRMRELLEKQVTLIFVSHDMGIVRDLCERSAYLSHGELVFFGPSQKAIQLYFQEDVKIKYEDTYQDSRSFVCVSPLKRDKFSQNTIWKSNNERNSKEIKAKIVAISMFDSCNEATMKARIGEKIRFIVFYKTYTQDPIHVSIAFKNRYNNLITCNGSYLCNIEPQTLPAGSYGAIEFQLKCIIEAGLYTVNFTLSHPSDLPNRGINLDETPWLGPLKIEWDYENTKAPFLGMFDVPMQCKFISVGDAI